MSLRFDSMGTPLPGLTLLRRKPIGDDRGFLERVFCADELKPLLGDRYIVQINRSLTCAPGTVRGMHFQYPPDAEMKMVTCLRGEVFDVAVDIRHDSPTFLQWHAEILSADNHSTLVIPEGFAHGFQTIVADCELLYLHTAAYAQQSEGGLNALDPRLAIEWPQAVGEMSARDRSHPHLDEEFQGVML